ncbi:MAG: O-antigen ligase family protein [Sphingorhabdus sp.]
MGWLNLDASILNYAGWPGHTKGLIITILDSLALAIVVTSVAPFKRLPLFGIMLVYFSAAALSVAFSNQPVTSSFYAFQWARVVLLFVAVASIMRDPRAIHWLAYGLAAGAVFQGVITIEQRLSGAVQAAGTMGHQNLLGFMLHFVTLPLMALLLAGKTHKLNILGVLFALIAVALGASRGTILFSAVGLVILVGLSLARQTTGHKWKILGAGVLAFVIVAPLAFSTIERRFGDAPVEMGADRERMAFERAATTMWDDHPMGVGANQYVVVANAKGYSERAGVIWNYGSRSAHVHNLYLLAGAETGWIGLFALVGLFGWAFTRGVVFAFSNRRDARADVVLGASVAVLAAALHSFYEWIFVTYQVQYVFAISLGVISGLVRQVKQEKHRRPLTSRAARADPPAVSDGILVQRAN